MACSVDVAGAVALLGRGVEGELADGQDAAAHIQDGTVHNAVLVVENT